MSLKQNHKQGTNHGDVQEMNRSLVIRLMRQMSVCSRADLAGATGLERATITHIINDLIDWGLVKETGLLNGKKGRRSIGITLNSEVYKVIGIRIARKYFSVGLFDIAGREYDIKTEEITSNSDSSETFRKIKSIVKNFLNDGKENFIGIGCAIPGPFFRNEGKMALITELHGWEKISIRQELEEAFGLPVFLEHDANVGALAEWWLGSSRIQKGTMVYVAAGQGIGAGIVIDGSVFRGALGVAGEIGHASINFSGPKCECGNNGCLTNYCSTLAFKREVEKNLPDFPESMLNEGCTTDLIFKALEAEDRLALSVLEQIAGYLSFGLINIIYTYNPDVIIIGDELSKAGPRLLKICIDKIQEHVLPQIYQKLSINLSSFDKDPILIGAGALAVDKVFRRPSLIRQKIGDN